MTLEDVLTRLRAAERKAGRPEGSVELIAVSKIQPPDRVEAALDAGHRLFGENRVQEAREKWPDLTARFDDVELHLIGPLQTNKVRAAMELFDAITPVDRPKLARAIARVAGETGACPKLFVQVNTGGEEWKAARFDDTDALVGECRGLGLPVVGLMCIPPADEEPSPHFALLAKLAERNGLVGLSMGMSGDFESAVELGATHVRVGSAVFGHRASGE